MFIDKVKSWGVGKVLEIWEDGDNTEGAWVNAMKNRKGITWSK